MIQISSGYSPINRSLLRAGRLLDLLIKQAGKVFIPPASTSSDGLRFPFPQNSTRGAAFVDIAEYD